MPVKPAASGNEGSSAMNAPTEDTRMHWLLNTVQAVEDLLQEKIDKSDDGQAPGARDPVIQELKISLEELRVVGEELKRQSEELALEKQRYADLFNYAPDAYVLTNLDAGIREANRAAAQLFQSSQHHLVGKPLALYVHESERQAFRTRLIFMAAGTGEQKQQFDLTVVPHPDARLLTRVSVSVVLEPRGRPKSLCWLLRVVDE
jgi:PAS domain S-box-containing protein